MHAASPSDVLLAGSERMDVAVVGGGVRCVVLLLQAATMPAHDAPRRIAVIDPERPGPGRIWRTDQSSLLVMNTLAHQSTVFEDEENTGPVLAEWRGLLCGALPPQRAASWPSGLVEHCANWAAAHPELVHRMIELTRDLPDTAYFPRATFGGYLAWAYDYAVHRLSQRARVEHVADRVCDITEAADTSEATDTTAETGGILRDHAEPDIQTAAAPVTLHLASGERIGARAAILSLGWGPVDVTREAEALAHVRAESPIDQDLDGIVAERPVLIRGMGMSMFDTLTLLTQGRGGVFSGRGDALRYHPSGAEPRILIGSRRGIPFRSQALPSNRPIQPPMPHLRALIARLPAAGVDFAQVRDAVDRDAIRRFYTVHQANAPAATPARLIHELDGGMPLTSWRALEARLVPGPERRAPDLSTTGGIPSHVVTAEDYASWAGEALRADISASAQGEQNATKMAMELYVASRSLMSEIVGFGRLSAETYPDFLDFMRLIGAAGGVPPLFRVRELEALVRAGVVELFGPDTEIVTANGERFDVRSRFAERTVDAVIDAFVPRPDIDHADSLLGRLFRRGTVSRYRYAGSVRTDALAVDADTNAVIRADGTVSNRIFSVGIPSEAARVFTIIAPIPGTHSPVLRECRAALAAACYALRSSVSA